MGTENHTATFNQRIAVDVGYLGIPRHIMSLASIDHGDKVQIRIAAYSGGYILYIKQNVVSGLEKRVIGRDEISVHLAGVSNSDGIISIRPNMLKLFGISQQEPIYKVVDGCIQVMLSEVDSRGFVPTFRNASNVRISSMRINNEHGQKYIVLLPNEYGSIELKGQVEMYAFPGNNDINLVLNFSDDVNGHVTRNIRNNPSANSKNRYIVIPQNLLSYVGLESGKHEARVSNTEMLITI
jgi:alpha-glucosidase (family GH31 glycosyl hydrolase)